MITLSLLFYCTVALADYHVLLHPFPTRRSSDLRVQCGCAGCHQLAALVERLTLLGGHRSGSSRDQADDKVRCCAAAAGSLGSCSGMVEAADQHGADVVGVRESPARENPREDDGEAVAVGFGTAELRSQWRDGVRSQEAFDVCLVQPDVVDQR